MAKAIQVGKILLVLIILVHFAGIGCAPSNKGGKAIIKRAQASKVNASQMGRNKLYFSPTYQKKLTRSYKKR